MRGPRLPRLVAVLRAVLVLHAVEEPLGGENRRRLDVQPRHLAALQGHQHPAGDRRIARLARIVTPAARVGVLGIFDIVQAALGRLLQVRIAGHAIGLAQGDRGQGVTVHRAVAEVVAVGDLDAAAFQVIQPALDDVLELALLMRVAGAEEGQQGHPVAAVVLPSLPGWVQ